MKNSFKKTTLAVAVGLAMGTSAAWAIQPSGSQLDSNVINADNSTSVSIDKTVSVTKDYTLEGKTVIDGKVLVNGASMAVVDNKQLNHNNSVDAPDPSFSAKTGTITGNSGNLGVNVTAGENNQQDNAAAISAIDKGFVLGSADAEIFSQQQLNGNDTNIVGADFTASTGVDFNTGNVGVNVSAGMSNLQKNNLAISTAKSGLAEASSATLQETSSITTALAAGVGPAGVVPVTYKSELVSVGGNTGNTGINVSTGNNNAQANSLSIASVN